MSQTENNIDFIALLKAAILESLLRKSVITKAEKAIFENKTLSSN